MMSDSYSKMLSILGEWSSQNIDSELALKTWPEVPVTPIGAAWFKAVTMRPFPVKPAALEGFGLSVRCNEWRPKARPTLDVVRRICTMTLCACSADALGNGDLERHTACVEHPLFLDDGPEWFEHPEAMLLLAVAQGGPLQPAVLAQLSWRDHAASTLAWALGWHDEDPLEDYGASRLLAKLPSSAEELKARVETSNLRPISELLAVLGRAKEGLEPASAPSLAHSMSVERVKALRWLTEPWWPELALTPWRDEGTGFEGMTTPEEFAAEQRAAIEAHDKGK